MRVVQGLVFVLCLTLNFANAQFWAHRYEPHNVFPKDAIDNQLLVSLLQEMMDKVKGRGFRYIGVKEDFFHGHLLYSEDSEVDSLGVMKPFAVLYHTQEEASHFSKSDPGGKFDYLDRKTRNWVQFVDEQKLLKKRIFNAYAFMIDKVRDDSQSLGSLKATRSHYTVFSEQLDSEKFPEGFRKKIIGTRQFDFYLHPCDVVKESKLSENMTEAEIFDFLYSTGVLNLYDKHSGENLCLKTQFNSFYVNEVNSKPSFYDQPYVVNDAIPTDYSDIYDFE